MRIFILLLVIFEVQGRRRQGGQSGQSGRPRGNARTERRVGESLDNLIIGGTSVFSSAIQLPGDRRGTKDQWDRLWTESGTVPERLKKLTPDRAFVMFPSGAFIRPNDTITTGLILQRPSVDWQADPSKMYTVMIEDQDINNPNFGMIKYFHWLVVNIPGKDVARGEAVMDWIPSFTFNYNPVTGLETDPSSTYDHRHLILVYEQPNGRMNVEERQNGCSPDIGLARVQDHDRFAEKYGLGDPVASNFFRVKYSGETTNQILCYYGKCTGEPFPALIPGVNDGPECQRN